MQEYSRIILEEYRRTHKSVRSRRIAELVELSYDVNSYASEADAIFLEKAMVWQGVWNVDSVKIFVHKKFL